MSGTPDQYRLNPDKPSLEPDTFWELVEKLLLRSSRDERLRHGHNLSLATLCRGYAVSKVTRDRKQASTQIKDSKTNLSAKSRKKLKTRSTDILSEKKSKAKVHAVQTKIAVGTKSESNLKDHDVVYVKDTEIPASERLWRFAIKNRKQKEGGENSIKIKSGVPRDFPSARSNEAIFEGLRQRLEEAKKAELEQKEAVKEQESKLKHKRRKKRLKSVSDCSDATHKNNATIMTKPASKSITNTSKEKSKHQKPSPSQATSSQPKASRSLQVSSGSEQTVTSSDGSQNTNAHVRSVTPEQVEAKKYLYDNVLKKRLHCGSQLETLNKEIINKKVNPRLVLSRDTTRKYAELKTEYLKLCYQESSLRHQIVMLQSEIYMMQNKNFHKRPAAIKTITLNSETAKVPQHLSMVQEKENENSRLTKSSEDVLLFPRLKAPRPLIIPMNNKNGSEKKNEIKDDRSENTFMANNFGELEQLPSLEVLRPHGVCSLYSLTTSLAERYPKRQPPAMIIRHKSQEKVAHRLPRMSQTVCYPN